MACSTLACSSTGTEGVRLYHNDGRGSFSEQTRRAGLLISPGVICTSAALGDLDGDGFPDLVVAAYTDTYRPPSKPIFTFPNDFAGTDSRLYRNNRNGTFTDVTESSWLANNHGRARKVVLADFDSDGRLDILLLRDDKPPALYLNRGGLKFKDATWDAGDDLTAYAFLEAAMADFNRDGKPDLALWSSHIFRVLINQGKAVFDDLKSESIPNPIVNLFGFRGAVVDLDGNAFDDVITVDRDGQLRAFLNQSGALKEMPIEAKESWAGSSMAAIRLKDAQRRLALSPDGSVVLLEAAGFKPKN